MMLKIGHFGTHTWGIELKYYVALNLIACTYKYVYVYDKPHVVDSKMQNYQNHNVEQ